MVSPGGTRPGVSAVPAMLLAGALAPTLGVAPAAAQPAPPDNAADAATALEQVQREAEALTVEWHAANDELTARQDELARMTAAVEPAGQAADAARAGSSTVSRSTCSLVGVLRGRRHAAAFVVAAGAGRPGGGLGRHAPGDLVFYYSPVSHVGIYAGDGKMINAPQTGDVVKYATVSSSAFSGARRI